MTSLEALQRYIADAVRSPTPASPDSPQSQADALIAPSVRGMRPAERVEVYREQFWLRHVPSLEEDYPTLAWILGAGPFRELAIDYLRAFPPRTWDLQRLGADLPVYVAQRVDGGYAALAGDAARLDWAFMEAFDAPDAPPFDPRVLAATPEDAWPRARIEFHPSLRTLDLGHPVHELRDALVRGATPGTPAPGRSTVVVWRDPGCHLRAMAIDALAFALLRELLSDAALGLACESIASADGTSETELGPRIAEWFQHWTANALVRAVTFPA